MSYLTGEEKTITIPLTFPSGDVIGNYTQITCILYYYSKPNYTPFAYFALVPGSLTPPVGFTIEQLTVSSNDLIMTVPATATENIDLANDSAKIYAHVNLGTNSAPNPKAKVKPIDLGKLEETYIKNWLV